MAQVVPHQILQGNNLKNTNFLSKCSELLQNYPKVVALPRAEIFSNVYTSYGVVEGRTTYGG